MRWAHHATRRVRSHRRRMTIELTPRVLKQLRRLRSDMRWLSFLLTDSSLEGEQRFKLLCSSFHQIETSAALLCSTFVVDFKGNGAI